MIQPGPGRFARGGVNAVVSGNVGSKLGFASCRLELQTRSHTFTAGLQGCVRRLIAQLASNYSIEHKKGGTRSIVAVCQLDSDWMATDGGGPVINWP